MTNIWFGGYTKKTSKGIYKAKLVNERVNKPELAVEIENATYFQISANNELFTIIKSGEQGGIAYFDLSTNKPKLVAQALAAGAPPAYLGSNEAQKLLYVANYHLGLLQVYSYEKNQLTLVDQVKHDNKNHGPKPEQASAHPHYFDLTPAGNLISADLGLDMIDLYEFKNQKLKHIASYQNNSGFGTRHLVFHPNKKIMFIVGELSSEVNVVKFDETNLTFENLGYYKTIPTDFIDHNGAAAIKLSKDGKFLYISNRGHDSLAVFAINQATFALDLIQLIKTEGSFPRDFNWDKGENFVVVANQNTDNASLYQTNPTRGFLTLIQKDIAVPEATRVLFKED